MQPMLRRRISLHLPPLAGTSITGLPASSVFVVRARGVNGVGAGEWGDLLATSTLKPLPPVLYDSQLWVANSTLTRARLEWSPAVERGSAVAQYVVQAARFDESNVDELSTGLNCSSSSLLQWTDVYTGQGLSADWDEGAHIRREQKQEQPGGLWIFRLAADSVLGRGDFVCRSFPSGPPVSLDTSPDQPLSVRPGAPMVLEIGQTFAVLSLEHPGGLFPTSVWRADVLDVAASVGITLEVPENSTSLSVGGLQLSSGRKYAVRVFGWNEAGPGPPSPWVEISLRQDAGLRAHNRADLLLPATGERRRGLLASSSGPMVPATALWPNVEWFSSHDASANDPAGLPVVIIVVRSARMVAGSPLAAFAQIAPGSTLPTEAGGFPDSAQWAAQNGSVDAARITEALEGVYTATISSLSKDEEPVAALLLDISQLPPFHGDEAGQVTADWLLETLETLTADGTLPVALSPERRRWALAGMGPTANEALRMVLERPELGRAALLLSPPSTGEASPAPSPSDQLTGSELDLFLYSAGPSEALVAAAAGAGCLELESSSPRDADQMVGSCAWLAAKAAPMAEAWSSALLWVTHVLQLPLLQDVQRDLGPNLSNEVVDVVWGISGVDRGPHMSSLFGVSTGEVLLDPSLELESGEAQEWVLRVCDTLAGNVGLVEREEGCVMRDLAALAKRRQLPWPVPRDNATALMLELLESNRGLQQAVGWDDLQSEQARMTWLRVSMRSKVTTGSPAWEAAKAWQQWEEAIGELQALAPTEAATAEHTCYLWVRMTTEQQIVEGLQLAVTIAVVSALFAILVFTGDPWMAVLTVINLAAIVIALLAVFWLMNWDIGAIEAISVTILVGLSCDFCLHLAEAYSHSGLASRKGRTVEAVLRAGAPISAAAVTTVMAVLPVLLCTIQVLRKFGVIIAVNISVALVYSLALFVPMLMVMGPMPIPMRLQSAFRWTRPIVIVLWGTFLRRISLLSLLLLAALLCIPATVAIVLDNLAVALPVALAMPALTLAVESVSACRSSSL